MFISKFSFYFAFSFLVAELFDASDLEKKRLKEEKIAKKKAEIEKQRDYERKKHVRPWDKAKLAGEKKIARSDSSESEEEEIKDWKPQREYQTMSQGENFVAQTAESC